MGLTVRVGALSACLGFILIGVVGWAGGCASGAGGSGAAATKKVATTKSTTTKASTKPMHETVTVELGEKWLDFAPRARGVLRPKPAPQGTAAQGTVQPPVPLPAELLAPLGKLAEGIRSAEPPMLVTLGDFVKFDGAFPGEKGNWSKWDAGVIEAVRKLRSDGRPVILEVWKEPNRPPFKDRVDFFSAWVHTVKLVKPAWPEAVMAGPGISNNDGGWIQEFLKVSKEWNVLPEIVWWHEDNLKHDISGHVGGMMNNFWQDGLNRDTILISPNDAIDGKYAAGDPAIFLGQMEKSVKDQSWQPVGQWFAFKLTHLFTGDNKPRSVYHTYKAYADLATVAGGKSVKVSESETVGGIVVWDEKKRTGRMLLGRNRTRVDEKKHVLGDVAVAIKGAVGAEVVARVSRIADSGAKASDGPTAGAERVYPVRNGEARVPLSGFVSGDAFLVEFTVRGTPVAATTRSTTTNAATRP